MPYLTQKFRLRRNTATRRHASHLRLFIAAACIFSAAIVGHAQATTATATRGADLQVGAGGSGANPDYSPQNFYGYFIYATLDFKTHFGAEAQYRQVNTTANNKLYERTYQIGGRYVRHYGIFNPYVRGMFGRGVFNFPNDVANLAYNMYGISGGVDINVIKSVNVRVDYEHESWLSFPPHGLQPNVISVGAAYHFH